MSQYSTGLSSVTNGSATVTGTNTLWASNVSAGDSFTIASTGVVYDVAAVNSNTSITLSVAYAGASVSGAVYAIGTSFTVPDSFPEMSQGDIETATIFTRGMRKIQSKFTGIAINTTAEIGQAVSDHEATNDHPLATTSAKGFLSGADKTKIDTVEDGATADQTKADIDALNIDADTLDGIDSLGFDAAGAADTAVSDHVALPDPHSQYADQANTYTETEVDELTGSFAYPSTTLASSSDISESVEPAIAAYPHIQGFRTGTGTALTFAQVVEEAAERGARLLTIQELEAGVSANAGFGYGNTITWTSSPAGVGLVYGNLGNGNGTRVVLNTNTDTAAGGYAVSVIGQRQWTDTQYAGLDGGASANFTTMPQVGGDPIVESGSNSNGRYTKFSDGTLICVSNGPKTFTFNSADDLVCEWTYPAAFSTSLPSLSWVVTSRGSLIGAPDIVQEVNVGSSTTSLGVLRFWSSGGTGPFSPGDSCTGVLTAIGRWF